MQGSPTMKYLKGDGKARRRRRRRALLSRLIVRPLWCWRQRPPRRTQFVALGLVLVRRLHEGEGVTAEPADATVGEWHYSIT